MRRTAEDVIEIGKTLIRQKERLPHGLFLPWIEAEFGMGEVTARKMMRVAEVYGDGKSTPNVGLNISAIYELAAPSTPLEVRIEIEKRIGDGELVSAADVRTLKAQYDEIAANLARTFGGKLPIVGNLIAGDGRADSKRHIAVVDESFTRDSNSACGTGISSLSVLNAVAVGRRSH